MSDQETEWASMLRAANGGDGRAYARFLRAVTPVLRGIVRARAGRMQADAVEDIVQEVLLAIHQKRHTWRDDDPLRPWLFAITRYKVVDAFRARGSMVHLPLEDFVDVLVAQTGTDPTAHRDMMAVIGHLDPRSAAIVTAVGIDGANIAETGRQMDMTAGAVRVALHRAMKRLAELRERHVE